MRYKISNGAKSNRAKYRATLLSVWSGLLLMVMFAPVQAVENPLLARADVQAYIAKISAEHQLDANHLSNLFAEVESQQSVLDAISRPAEHVLNWAQYRPIFIKQKRVDQGREFMQTHRATLASAEEQFGVPASIIAAIIGVETYYGRITGKHGVLESVATLAFDYPPRSSFFTSELTEFLKLSQAEGWDTLGVKGSYAGAMGWPQFISSSYRHYAIDFDDDGQRDLFGSIPDIIGSVANYLKKHGWRAQQPIAERITVKEKDRVAIRALKRKSLKPAVAPKTMSNLGYEVSGTMVINVMNLQGKGGEETWVGYTNFYVITRYNHSKLYALAVYQLSELLSSSSAR